MHSSIRKLQKFLQLETERSYDNRAVVGGLDKVIPAWTKEARDEKVEQQLIEYVVRKIGEYAELDVQGRKETVYDLLSELKEVRPYVEPEVRQPVSDQNLSPSAVRSTPPPPPQPASIEPIEELAQIIEQETKVPDTAPVHTPPPVKESDLVALGAPLTTLSGIGKRYAQTFSKLGINCLYDLLFYFPRRYDDYSKLKPINRLEYGDELTIIATVQSSSSRQINNGRMNITEVIVSDGTGFLRLTWFNQPWVANSMKPGTQLVLSGKVDMYLGRLVMTNPEWEPLEQEHLHTNRIVPVYPLSAKITQRWLRRMMHQIVAYWAPRVRDHMPTQILKSARLLDLANAILQIHFPDSLEQLTAARNRLAFDEIFMLQIRLGVPRRPQHPEKGNACGQHHRDRVDLIGQVAGIVGGYRGADREEAKPGQFEVIPHFASLRPACAAGPDPSRPRVAHFDSLTSAAQQR